MTNLDHAEPDAGTALVPLSSDVLDNTRPLDPICAYTQYLVLHRTLLQSMPASWQRPFAALLRQFFDAYRHLPQSQAYDVAAGDLREFGELDAAEHALLGVTVTEPAGNDDNDEPEQAAETVYTYRGEEFQRWETVVVPHEDPVPGPNRGRTYLAPRPGWTCPNTITGEVPL